MLTNFVKALPAILFVLIVGGCTSTTEPPVVVETRFETPDIPNPLRVLCSIPDTPPRGASNETVALYTLSLYENLEECRSKHESVISVIDDFEARMASLQASDNL